MSTRHTLPLLALALTASSAHAEPGTHLSETLAFSPAPSREEVSSTGLSLTLAIDWKTPSGWFFGATAGATFAHIDAPAFGSTSSLDPSNLALSGGIRVIDTHTFDLDLGLHLAAPLALFWGDSIQAKRTSEYNHLAASTARGQRDAWLWQMNTIPVGVTLDLDLRLNDHLDLILSAEPTALISLNSRPTRLALSSSLELRASWHPVELHLGWTHFVDTLALENLDHDQHAASLGLGLRLGEHELALTASLNLDGPWGIETGEAKPTWGLALSARHRL